STPLIARAMKELDASAASHLLPNRRFSTGIAFLTLPVSSPGASGLIAEAARASLPPDEGNLLSSRRLRTRWGRTLPSASPHATALIAAALKAEPRLPEDTPVTAAEPPTTTATGETAPSNPVRNSAGGYSLARQLGLTVSRIVIDPGHGGHDPGAK